MGDRHTEGAWNMKVESRFGSYEISFIKLTELWGYLPENCCLVTDSNVVEVIPGLKERNPIVVPAGEESKSFDTYRFVVTELAKRGVKRSGSLAAVGGGVVGDLGGVAAASYMRGIDFWQVPTSLLAMVDSSVGGKVGIDLAEGKNLVGAFWAPKAVLVAPECLKTLPERQFKAGLAEVLKMGFIRDPELLNLDRENPQPWIERAIDGKRQVVEADEFETNGLRATLNFGHTIGHMLESRANYQGILHGEAVAIGMVAEAEFGEYLGVTPAGTAEKVREVLAENGLPVELPTDLNPTEALKWLQLDKKSGTKTLGFSLLTGIGSCKLKSDIEPSQVLEWLETR
jgi:3-dehydroquinate synthase